MSISHISIGKNGHIGLDVSEIWIYRISDISDTSDAIISDMSIPIYPF
jgi:hypothetical protein